MLNGRWWPQQLRAQQFVSMVERRECVKDSVKHGEIDSATASRKHSFCTQELQKMLVVIYSELKPCNQRTNRRYTAKTFLYVVTRIHLTAKTLHSLKSRK